MPWNNLVEAIRQCWGDVWICFHLANIASGVKSNSETYKEFYNLLDHSKDLCKRSRYARLRAGQHSWWIKQVEEAKNEIDIAFTLLILITWASSKTLEKMIYELDDSIQKIAEPIWQNLYKSVEEALSIIPQPSDHHISLDASQTSNSLSPKTIALLSLRAKSNTRKLLYSRYLKYYDGSDLSILKLCHNMSLEFLANDYSIWEEVRNVIQRSYSKGVMFDPYLFHRLNREITSRNIPKDIAEEIASNPSDYPSFLVAISEIKLKEIVASKVVPVGKTAIENKWFDHL